MTSKRASWLTSVLIIGWSVTQILSPSAMAYPVLSAREVAVAVTLEVGDWGGGGATAISVAPDIYFGLTDALTVGITHSNSAQSEIGSGNGFCLNRARPDCVHAYDNLGVDGLYRMIQGSGAQVALRTRLRAAAFDPFKLQVKLGAYLSYRYGRVALHGDPHLGFGLTNRDLGNRDMFNLPLWFEVRALGPCHLWFRTGIQGQLHNFAQVYEVPVGAGLRVTLLGSRYTVEVGYAFARLLGPQNWFKQRHFWVSLIVRSSRHML